MPRFAKMQPKDGPVPTFLCRNRAEVTRALTQIRTHLGISQLELDEIAGFHTGYTGKLEQFSAPGMPGQRGSGRSAIHPMFDIWLGALKVDIVIIPRGEERDITGARPPAPKNQHMNTKRAQKVRKLWDNGNGVPINTLARQFDVSRGLIRNIVEGRAFMPEGGEP